LSFSFVTSISATEAPVATEESNRATDSPAEPEQFFTAYIVNLAYSTTLQQIHDLFSQHAPVTKVYMPFDKQEPQRSKGYAFVSVGSKDELDKVIRSLHESQLDGRTVFVSEAKPRSAKSTDASSNEASTSQAGAERGRPQNASTKLYVGNISYDTTAEDLADLFSPYGKVVDTYLPVDNASGTPRGFAFVTLSSDDVDAAIQDIDGIEFNGRCIVVNKPLPRGEKVNRGREGGREGRTTSSPQASSRRNADSSNTAKLYVGNLSFDTTEEDVRSLFEPFGQLTDVYVPVDQGTGRRRGFAFVTLNADEASTAIEETDGLEVDGRVLRVNAAQPKGF